jgi:hypothetical protein
LSCTASRRQLPESMKCRFQLLRHMQFYYAGEIYLHANMQDNEAKN